MTVSDDFGQTVNIAARVQGLAVSSSNIRDWIGGRAPGIGKAAVDRGLEAQRAALRGIADEMTVYAIP